MSRREAPRRSTPLLQVEWPALDEPSPATEPAGELVYLWNAGAEPEPLAETVPREDYLAALVGLVDELTQRLVASERALARAEAERDAALALGERRQSEATEAGRQLLAYCRSLVDSNCALDEARAENGRSAKVAAEARATLTHLAQSPLALPLRARLLALADTLGPRSG